MKFSRYALYGAAALALAASVAVSQVATLPQLGSFAPTDLIQDVPGGVPGVGGQYASGAILNNAIGGGAPTRGNALIGGDATTNLWQRGTAGATATTTVAYGSADRWAIWSGTNTAIKLIRSSTAADLPAGYQYALKLARTSGQTGVVQVCMAQEVESANSYQFQGATAELDFHAFTGANFSAASANMTAYIITGTGADEGMSALAFGLNAGGGGGSGWTGQANATAAVISLGAVSTAGRYAAIAAIPATATEIGVALCYTPVGTAGTNDYIAFDGIQLVRNPFAASFVNTTAGYNIATTTGLPATAFERRGVTVETAMQQRYFWRIAEGAASIPTNLTGTYDTTTTCELSVATPVTMRVAPTVALTGTAVGATTWAIIANSATPIALGTPYLSQSTLGTNTVNAVSLTATTAAKTAGFGCKLVGATGGGNIDASSEL